MPNDMSKSPPSRLIILFTWIFHIIRNRYILGKTIHWQPDSAAWFLMRLNWEFSNLFRLMSWRSNVTDNSNFICMTPSFSRAAPLLERTDAWFLHLTRPDGAQWVGMWSPSFNKQKADVTCSNTGPDLTQRAEHTVIHISMKPLIFTSWMSASMRVLLPHLHFKASHHRCISVAAVCHYSCWHKGRSPGMHLQMKPALDKGACQRYGHRESCMRGMLDVGMNYTAQNCVKKPHRHSATQTAILQCAIGTKGCSHLDVFPHAVGQYSHQDRYCGMSHVLSFFCLFWFILWNNCLPLRCLLLQLKWWTLRSSAPSCDISCVCVLLALADGLSNGSLGFYVDEAWQNQALFLRVFITEFTHGVLAVV